MPRATHLSRTALGLCLCFAMAGAEPQLNKIRDYKLHQPEDHGVLFGMTLGPDNNLFTLVARKDGHWPLTQVEHWWDDGATERQLFVEGFSKRDSIGAFGQIKLTLSPDGQYLIAVIVATRLNATPDPLPVDMIIDVIRLDQFRIVATAHTKQLGMKGYLQGALDKSGRLIVESSIQPAVRGGSGTITWYSFTLPELTPSIACSFQSPAGARDSKQALETACGRFASDGRYKSATDLERALSGVEIVETRPDIPKGQYIAWRFFKRQSGDWVGMNSTGEELDVIRDDGQKMSGFQPESLCAKQPVRGPAWSCSCGFLGELDEGAVAVACETSHDNLFGASVGLDQWIAAVDLEHEKDLGKTSVRQSENFQARSITIGDKRVILVVMNGSRLLVYSAPR